MKKLFTLLALLIAFGASAQIEVKQHYEEVVEVENSKDVLFKNAQTWVANTFGNYKSVVQFEDKEAGKIVLKGKLPLNIKSDSYTEYSYANFTMSIECKNDRYRYTTQLIGFDYMLDFDKKNNSVNVEVLKQVSSNFENLLNKAKNELSKATKKEKEKAEKSVSHYLEKINGREKLYRGTNEKFNLMIENFKIELLKNDNW